MTTGGAGMPDCTHDNVTFADMRLRCDDCDAPPDVIERAWGSYFDEHPRRTIPPTRADLVAPPRIPQ